MHLIKRKHDIIKEMGAWNSSKASVTEEKIAPFSKDDNIAVIGAGAGGVHLAAQLIKKLLQL